MNLSQPQSQCFTLKLDGGSSKILTLADLLWKLCCGLSCSLVWVKQQQCCVLIVSCDWTPCFLLLTPTLLCAGRRKVEQTRGSSLHPGRAGRCQAGQEEAGYQKCTGEECLPQDTCASQCAHLPCSCHPRMWWVSQPVTEPARDFGRCRWQGSRKSEGKSIWDTAEKLPSLFGSLLSDGWRSCTWVFLGSCFQPSAALWKLE